MITDYNLSYFTHYLKYLREEEKLYEKNMKKKSKREIVIDTLLDENGFSEIIDRYSLKGEIHYTSGDSIFRNDSALGKEYKFFRFSKKFDANCHSQCWDFTDDDEEEMKKIHSTLEFKRSGATKEYIQFFGKVDKIDDDKWIAPWIRKKIYSMPCCNCGATRNIQCDHKDDFKTDQKVLNKETQKLEHFQPLCGSCNGRKREDKMKTIKTGKRQPPPRGNVDFGIDFIEGDETFDKNKPNRVGTYWYDCVLFRKKAIEMIIQKNNIQKSEE